MRELLVSVSVALGLVALSGCGGSGVNGSVGGGNGPQPGSGQPVVTAISPSSVVAHGPSFTLTVT